MKALMSGLASFALLLTAFALTTSADEPKKEEGPPCKLDHLDKAWNLKCKTVSMKDTVDQFRISVKDVRVTLEFTKDAMEVKAIRAAFQGLGYLAAPKDGATRVMCYFFDEDNVALYKGYVFAPEGEITGKMGDAFRVTFRCSPNGYKDCLQKVHEVGPFTAMGFAGSALIGFQMVERLKHLLAAGQPDEAAFEPEAVAQWWPEEAREVFRQVSHLVDDPTCELMLLSANPTQDIGIPNWARCYVHSFRSPNFEPELAEAASIGPIASKAVAIGCGNESALYREALDYAPEDYVGTHGPARYREFVGRLVSRVRLRVVEYPTPYVSPLLQICIVSRQFIQIIDANGTRYGPGGEVTDFNVPKLATNLLELDLELQGLGGSAKARC